MANPRRSSVGLLIIRGVRAHATCDEGLYFDGNNQTGLRTMKIAKIAAAVVLSLGLAACQTTGGPKQTAGTVVGAGLGALIGSQFGKGTGKLAAIGAGTFLGALLGSEIGRSMDEADRRYAAQTAQQALEYNKTGAPAEWRNPDNGHSGQVVPTRTYRTADGRYCREFQQTVTIGGRTESAYGTACRQPDGSWQIVSN